VNFTDSIENKGKKTNKILRQKLWK